MDRIAAAFNAEFARWDIRLPTGAVEALRRGKIVRAGWAIWYLSGGDARGEYLDYYASHRMTSDRHVRIRADGSKETLPAIQDFRASSTNLTEDARLEAACLRRNRRVARLLQAKGFGIRGDEPVSVQVNRYLCLRGPDTEGGSA